MSEETIRARADTNIIRFVSAEARIRQKYEALGGTAVLGEPISKEEDQIWTFEWFMHL